jgi:sulfate transport system substrate-binding protein
VHTLPKVSALILIMVAGLWAAACGGSSEAGAGGGRLSLVAYSTPREAYEALIPAFRRTPAGAGVTVTQSYGNSGDQARAVIAGLPADVVALSLEPDVTKLVDAKLVAPGWRATPTRGMVTRSVVVLAVRKGNPKDIRGWDDLLRPGVEVLTPNPFTSGGARWNVMAAYGAQLAKGRSEAQAVRYLEQLFRHVPVQDKSAREALQTFAGGKGDVLIAYENEAITARQKGEGIDYVIPDETILIENPVAVTTKAGPEARAFADFLSTPAAQRIFVAKGYRPVLDRLADPRRHPEPPKQFRITELGGWAAVMQRFFDPKGSVMADVERSLGVSTG